MRQGRGVLSTNPGQCRTPLGPTRPAPWTLRALRGSQALPQLYLGQLDGFIELVQGTLEVCDLWGTMGRAQSLFLLLPPH